VRTTLTLDDDVAAKLKAEARRTGRPFKQVINEALRAGLQRRDKKSSQPFTVHARDLGEVRPGVSLDNVSDLLEQLEGPSHR
jgi:hypothetical protein